MGVTWEPSALCAVSARLPRSMALVAQPYLAARTSGLPRLGARSSRLRRDGEVGRRRELRDRDAHADALGRAGHGAHQGDDFGTDRYMKELTLRQLPDASHFVQQDAPEEANAMLEARLSRRPVPGARSE